MNRFRNKFGMTQKNIHTEFITASILKRFRNKFGMTQKKYSY